MLRKLVLVVSFTLVSIGSTCSIGPDQVMRIDSVRANGQPITDETQVNCDVFDCGDPIVVFVERPTPRDR